MMKKKGVKGIEPLSCNSINKENFLSRFLKQRSAFKAERPINNGNRQQHQYQKYNDNNFDVTDGSCL